jgi:hypothetical protein
MEEKDCYPIFCKIILPNLAKFELENFRIKIGLQGSNMAKFTKKWPN